MKPPKWPSITSLIIIPCSLIANLLSSLSKSLLGGLFLALTALHCQPQPISTERYIDPRSQAYLQQGTLALEQHEFEAALVMADSAEAFTPQLSDVSFLRGRIYSELGDFEKADSLYRLTLAQTSGYRGVWHNLGNNEFRRHQYEEAVASYRKEAELHPAPIPWRGLGRAYVELGEVEKALDAFLEALKIDSSYAPAHFNIALLYEDEGEFDDALSHARKASSLSPDDLDYRYLMASLLVTTNRHEEAIPHLQLVADAWPWHHASHYKLGQSLVRTGNSEEGQPVLQKAESLRDQDAGIVQLLNSAQSAPDDPYVHAALGSALRGAGRYEDALRAYKIARYLDPANLEIQTNMANLYLLKGDTLGSIRGYQSILQQDPSFLGIWLNLGIVHALAGQPDKAQQAWKQALELDPDNEAAKAYLARLEKEPR